MNPKKAVSHAARAMKKKYRGMTSNGSNLIAFANWKVQTVYIPSGNTIPQYCGS
jgi:hypothetical protein